MTINERLFNEMKEKKLKSTDLANILNINKTVISAWKSRGTNPPSEYIVQICEFLDISINYLLTGKEENEIASEEKELIKYYRTADQRGKRTIMRTAREEAEEQKSLISVSG